MSGRETPVLRLLSAAALLVVLAAGCGGAGRSGRAVHGVPRGLAQGWENRAEAIAAAASAGNDCHARELAVSLNQDVVQARHKLPLRVRAPLLTAVSSLADRTTCTPVVTNPAPPKNPHPPHKGPKHKPPKTHGPHGHDKEADKGRDK
jgi:hypothetical protein